MAKDAAQTSGEQTRAAVAMSTEQSVTANLAAVSVGEDINDPTAERLKWRERISYGIGDVGGNLIFGLITSFLLFYLTDTVGIGAAIAGTLLLLGRVMDGIMDLIIGTLVDKTSTRWGKARPWILFSAPFLVITFVMLFNVPAGLTQTGKEVFAFVFYFLCLGVGYVASNLSYHTLLSVITSSSKMRVSLTVVRTICALVTGLTVNVITIPVITALGGGQSAWTITAIIYGAISLITLLVVFFGTRERVRPATKTESSAKLPLGTLLKILLRNPYFYLGFVFFFLVYILSGTSGAGIYFAQDVLGDANLYSLLSIVTLTPLIVGIWFMPPIIGRWGKRKPMLIGVGVTLIGVAVTFIDPTNMSIVLVGALIRAIGGVPAAASMFALIADVVDYGEWKSGVRVDGMTYAAATAGQNFGAGVGVAIVGWLLAAGNYQPGGPSQPASATSMEVFLYLGLPAVVAVLQGVVVYFLNIDKHMPRMQRELASRRLLARAVDS